MSEKFHWVGVDLKIFRRGVIWLLTIECALQIVALVSFMYAQTAALYRRYEAKKNNWFTGQQEQAWWDRESRLLRQSTRYHPFLGFLTTHVSTPHITVDSEGVRRTIGNPQTGASPLRSIFLFGGSTMAGYYASDGETIASYLVRELNRTVPRAVVTNFGQMAFVGSQELMYLMLQLQNGAGPDMVIFYDGCNELTLATSEDPTQRIFYENTLRAETDTFERIASSGPVNRSIISGAFWNEVFDRIQTVRLIRKIARSVDLKRRQPTKAPLDPVSDRATRIEGLVASYRGSTAVIEALARSYGFSYAFVWQPMSFTKPLTAQEKKTFVVSPSVYGSMQAIYLGASERLTGLHNPHFYDLTGIFQTAGDRSLFIDSCHVTPEGNARIASEIGTIVRANFGWEK